MTLRKEKIFKLIKYSMKKIDLFKIKKEDDINTI